MSAHSLFEFLALSVLMVKICRKVALAEKDGRLLHAPSERPQNLLFLVILLRADDSHDISDSHTQSLLMQILYILTYTFALSVFVFRNHCFLLESSNSSQKAACSALGLLVCFCPTLGCSHMRYMILSQLNIWCFLRGGRREDVVCSMWACLLVPEEQESDAKND